MTHVARHSRRHLSHSVLLAAAVALTTMTSVSTADAALAPRPDGTYKVLYARVDAVSSTDITFTPLSDVSWTGSGAYAANRVYGNPDPSTGRRFGYRYDIESPTNGDMQFGVTNPANMKATLAKSSPRVASSLVGRVVSITADSTTDKLVRTDAKCKVTTVWNNSSSKASKTISNCTTDWVDYKSAVLTLTSVTPFKDGWCTETSAVKVPLPLRRDESFKTPVCMAGSTLFAAGPEYPVFESYVPDMYPVSRPSPTKPWFESRTLTVKPAGGTTVVVSLNRGRWAKASTPVPASFKNASVSVVLDVADDGKGDLTVPAGTLSR